jgi:hypothetical protein
MSRATKGTGIAVRTVGSIVGTGLAVIAMFVVLIVIGMVAIPYGAFAATRDIPATTDPDAIDAEFNEVKDKHCFSCGQIDTELKEVNGRLICPDCKPLDSKEGGGNEEAVDKD